MYRCINISMVLDCYYVYCKSQTIRGEALNVVSIAGFNFGLILYRHSVSPLTIIVPNTMK
jgi:hypothetical protein